MTNRMGIFQSLYVGAGLVAMTAAPVSAKILFVETFSTGTTPTATGQWTVNQTGTDFSIETDAAGQGPGDGLLVIRGSGDGGSPAWGDVIYSNQAFTRGNNLRVSFRMWNKFGTNALTAFHGPWHNSNTGPQYANIEAGVDYTYNDFRWGEGIPPNGIQGGGSLAGINSHFNGNTKNGSLLLKVLLGDVRGARLDWYQTDPNAGTRDKAEPEKDTLGLTNDPANGGRVTGSSSQVYLGFGNFDSQPGSIYIDDIIVENDVEVAPGGPTLLFVGATREWNAASGTDGNQVAGGDFRLRQYLESLGWNVVFKDDDAVVTGDATGMAAVIVSSTVGSAKVNTKFTNVAVPVIVWENGLFDDMNIANSFGTSAAGQTQIDVDQAHPIAGSLSGTVTVCTNGDTFRHCAPSAGATGAVLVGTIVGQPTQGAIVAYETGSQMENGATAPARRVGFFLGDFLASETLTPEGKALLESTINWATNYVLPVEISAFEVE